MEPRDQAEHDEDEHEAGQVERAHQLAERDQRADAVLADRERHRAERADRRDLHDEADDREQHVRHLLDPVEHQRAAAAEPVQREAEQHREQQHLQDLALGERVDDGGGDDVEQEIGRALHLAGLRVGGDALGVERRRVDVHPAPGCTTLTIDEADDQRERADDLEVEQRVAAGLADLLHVLHAGDADDDRAEDDRRDDHLDQLDEAVAERLHRRAGLGKEVAEQNADDDRDDHLEVERLVERLVCACHLNPPQSIVRISGVVECVTRRRLPAPGGRRDNWNGPAGHKPRAQTPFGARRSNSANAAGGT